MMLDFLHRKNKALVSISKKQLKKFFMFEELRSKAIKYVYSQTDDKTFFQIGTTLCESCNLYTARSSTELAAGIL